MRRDIVRSAMLAAIKDSQRSARTAAAALIRERAPALLPRVVAEAASGDASGRDQIELERRLAAFLDRRIPPWTDALAAEDDRRPDAIRELLRTDAEAGDRVPPVVLLGTVAIGYRAIEAEIRAHAADYGYSADVLWGEVELLRSRVAEMRREQADDGRVA